MARIAAIHAAGYTTDPALWAAPARWIELELLGIRLVIAGHTPAETRAWLVESFGEPIGPEVQRARSWALHHGPP